ncbi:hypothetical protein AVEN_82392-1 [Araneus ventricosus]|uniref:Uncharacterized protein n=1 Tax=Araneus ventricosus TaxID=182803 RepID=A0A4Y2R9A6_ARAVE|nr:hypothetical protein AVEN_82392-1 [Araneus ventricosus]
MGISKATLSRVPHGFWRESSIPLWNRPWMWWIGSKNSAPPTWEEHLAPLAKDGEAARAPSHRHSRRMESSPPPADPNILLPNNSFSLLRCFKTLMLVFGKLDFTSLFLAFPIPDPLAEVEDFLNYSFFALVILKSRSVAT